MWVRVDISGLFFLIYCSLRAMSPFATMCSKGVCFNCICELEKMIFKYGKQIGQMKYIVTPPFLLLEGT